MHGQDTGKEKQIVQCKNEELVRKVVENLNKGSDEAAGVLEINKWKAENP